MKGNWFRWVLWLENVKCGKNLRLKGLPIIFNTSGARIRIGDNVTINSSFFSNFIGLNHRTIIITRSPGAAIEIGDHVGISGGTIYARKGIYIGNNTAIGGNCKILDNDFHPLKARERIRLLKNLHGGNAASLIPSKEIRIGENCFIGCNSIILKGTVLGNNCVVGAGAVVAGKFGPGCVIAGNPAKVIRKNI